MAINTGKTERSISPVLIILILISDLMPRDEAILQPVKYDKRKEILPIAERYKQITSTWAGYREENDSIFDEDDDEETPVMPVIAAPKTGRNDPCPCGSGKKYKKCCLIKQN